MTPTLTPFRQIDKVNRILKLAEHQPSTDAINLLALYIGLRFTISQPDPPVDRLAKETGLIKFMKTSVAYHLAVQPENSERGKQIAAINEFCRIELTWILSNLFLADG